MQRKLNRTVLYAFLLWLGVLFPQNAQAYIDPGTGSYVLQIAIAGIAAGAFALKIFWRKIKRMFSGSNAPEQSKQDPNE